MSALRNSEKIDLLIRLVESGLEEDVETAKMLVAQWEIKRSETELYDIDVKTEYHRSLILEELRRAKNHFINEEDKPLETILALPVWQENLLYDIFGMAGELMVVSDYRVASAGHAIMDKIWQTLGSLKIDEIRERHDRTTFAAMNERMGKYMNEFFAKDKLRTALREILMETATPHFDILKIRNIANEALERHQEV